MFNWGRDDTKTMWPRHVKLVQLDAKKYQTRDISTYPFNGVLASTCDAQGIDTGKAVDPATKEPRPFQVQVAAMSCDWDVAYKVMELFQMNCTVQHIRDALTVQDASKKSRAVQ